MIEQLNVLEATDELSSMAELNSDLLKKNLENIRKGKGKLLKWLDPENDLHTLERIKEVFQSLSSYCKEIVKDKVKLKDVDTQQGVEAMIQLAKEAARNLNQHKQLWGRSLKDPDIHTLKEYQELYEIYDKKFAKGKKKGSDLKKQWPEALGEESLVLESREVKDLETIKEDLQYELLYLQKEDGKRFFNRSLLRHIKLVNDFERLLVAEAQDDPFLKIQTIRDKESLAAAKEIKEDILSHCHCLLKKNEQMQESEFCRNLTFGVYALVLATSHYNLVDQGGKKNCLQYFKDFGFYLTKAFTSSDYYAHSQQAWIELDEATQQLILLSYDLCLRFFIHKGSNDQMMGFIKQFMNPDTIPTPKHKKGANPLWGGLLVNHEKGAELLKNYPNGPLFKTLDDLVNPSYDVFEPLAQENTPRLLYTVHNEKLKVNILRLPSPTRQMVINKAESSVLFEVFIIALRQLKNGQNFLVINMQDRTSWQEHARCQALENLPNHPRMVEGLQVCSLSKHTPFYHQVEEYHDLSSAKEFITLLQDQILHAEECGFYFPQSLGAGYIQDFVKSCVGLIHEHFFGKKGILSRKNRLDFIELLYFFLTLKMIDITKPTQMSFSCKDAIDTGAIANAGFFAFVKLMSEDSTWSLEEEDFFVWMAQSSALMYRERLVRFEEYERMLSVLELLDQELSLHKTTILKAFESLYGYAIFKNLYAQELK